MLVRVCAQCWHVFACCALLARGLLLCPLMYKLRSNVCRLGGRSRVNHHDPICITKLCRMPAPTGSTCTHLEIKKQPHEKLSDLVVHEGWKHIQGALFARHPQLSPLHMS